MKRHALFLLWLLFWCVAIAGTVAVVGDVVVALAVAVAVVVALAGAVVVVDGRVDEQSW